MLTKTRTVAINAAFLQEIKDDNRELRQLLRRAATNVSVPHLRRGQSRELVDVLSQLCDQLAMHFALEEAFGYFEDAVDIAPRLSQRADELRAEHESLFRILCDMVEHAEQVLYRESSRGVMRGIALRFNAFHDQFQEHETRENELILEAFDEDIGVGD